MIPAVIYSSEMRSLNAQERRKIEVSELKCPRNICGIRRVVRVRNSLIRERCGCKLSILERNETNVSKGFRHVERLGWDRMVNMEVTGGIDCRVE